MKRVSIYLKMKVLGALEFAEGKTMLEQYKSVSQQIFKDEEGVPYQFTWRTIQTWWYYYRQHGITENPKRTDSGKPRKTKPEELLFAIEKVMPHFNNRNGRINVAAIYRECIKRGLLHQEQIAANTFRRHVKRFDLLKPENENNNKRRQAFAKAHANDMWQCDTMVGPYIRINGTPKQTYLICFIDDASRVITHGEFYLQDNTANLIDCFQQAIFKRGVPKSIYVDNGSNYASKEMSLACVRLGSLLIHTPVRDGAAKGKIERFFRTVRDQFLIQNLSSIALCLESLNRAFKDWLENDYHCRKHSILDMLPLDRFGMDLERVQWLQPSIFNKEIFYTEKTRKVRADNTFSFNNQRYEAPVYLPKTNILIRFDKANPHQAPIVYNDGIRLGEAELLDYQSNDRRNTTS